ncbi:hypothetical protein GALMADRAFT_147502 [Galerina marginata CBS 339.88]|uniref:Uncharacterized protein n=1 Tax=Galerina marginata (strain CBS 339.88) TaxID=685588 RepID=A0A067S7P4_GALM3|nr:hypothetical protein GALMADRAFT_147502 [Galerina marginata CBS 339.88]
MDPQPVSMDSDPQPVVNQRTPSQPGFGYIVLPFPQEATFKQIGRHFTLSYLPSALADTTYHEINTIRICLWLGPEQQQIETNIFLIWPGYGILSFGELFSKQKSTVIRLINDTGAFTDVAPNDIARDLLYINRRPCLLFIWWSGPPNSVVLEATKLSLKTLVLSMVGNLAKELLDTEPGMDGDAVQSPMVQRWYLTMLESLRLVPKDQFLFDPTRVAHGIVTHLGKSLMINHRFDIRSRPMLYIPKAFIRVWAEQIDASRQSEGNMDSLLKEILS